MNEPKNCETESLGICLKLLGWKPRIATEIHQLHQAHRMLV